MSEKSDAYLKTVFAQGLYPPFISAFEPLIDSKMSWNVFTNPATSSTQTLDIDSIIKNTWNPTADHDVKQPTTDILIGFSNYHKNTSSIYTITLKSSNGSEICKLTPKSWVILEAITNTPTTNAHWITTDAGGGWVSAGTVAGNFGSGFGTVTTITSGFCRRGPNALWSLQATSGTVDGSSKAVIEYPYGLSSSSSPTLTGRTFGWWSRMVDSQPVFAGSNGHAYRSSTPTKIQLDWRFSNGGYKDEDVNAFIATGEVLRMEVEFPVLGWEIL